MITEVAKTPFYTVVVDATKNRLYLSVIGFWHDPTDVPSYLADIGKSCQSLKKGFTILTDLTQMKPGGPGTAELHADAQKLLIAAGLRKTAEVVAAGTVTKMQVDRISRTTQMTKQTFENKKEAEVWLDEA